MTEKISKQFKSEVKDEIKVIREMIANLNDINMKIIMAIGRLQKNARQASMEQLLSQFLQQKAQLIRAKRGTHRNLITKRARDEDNARFGAKVEAVLCCHYKVNRAYVEAMVSGLCGDFQLVIEVLAVLQHGKERSRLLVSPDPDAPRFQWTPTIIRKWRTNYFLYRNEAEYKVKLDHYWGEMNLIWKEQDQLQKSIWQSKEKYDNETSQIEKDSLQKSINFKSDCARLCTLQIDVRMERIMQLNNPNKLATLECFNLHGLTKQESKVRLRAVFADIQSKLNEGFMPPNQGNGKHHIYKVICGFGHHAENGKGKLKVHINMFIEQELKPLSSVYIEDMGIILVLFAKNQ